MSIEKEIVMGLSDADIENIADQIYNRKDTNHPQSFSNKSTSFIDILENAKPDISASPIFIRKVSL